MVMKKKKKKKKMKKKKKKKQDLFTPFNFYRESFCSSLVSS